MYKIKETTLTCRICKKRFMSTGKSTCSDACFLSWNASFIKYSDRRLASIARRKKKRLENAAKTKLSLPPPVPKLKVKRNKRIRKRHLIALENENQALRSKIERLQDNSSRAEFKQSFYTSPQWREIRYQAIKMQGRKCVLCGTTNKELHVDHIKPRSKFPELELTLSNLQILCIDCNFGKSNKDDTDWRKT